MKILLLSHKFSPDIGGIESISEILANDFSGKGHQVRVVTWSAGNEMQNAAYKVVRKPGVIELLKQHSWADVVFENNPCLRLSWPAALLAKPSVVGLQTWLSEKGKEGSLQAKLKRQWLKRAKKVIACSEAIRKVCWPKANVIGNPYQHATFKMCEGIEKTNNFIFVGRLVSDKGAAVAIEAFKKLVATHNHIFGSVLLNIVGDGEERDNLEKLVAQAGLENNIRFLGSKRGADLVNILNQHQYMIVPSTWEEPFGIVALEGLACGCLPIVSNAGGLPDAIGKSGLVFKTGDSNSLAEQMLSVFNNKPLINKLRQSASEHLKGHSANEISKQYLALIEGA